MRLELPVESPVCRHAWGLDAARAVWVCATCGYEVAERELHEAKEGDAPVGPNEGVRFGGGFRQWDPLDEDA